MKTMIWKELRENARWAALILLGLLLAEISALASLRGIESSEVTLCSGIFQLVSICGCAAAGAALGALQILPEQGRDRWASLLHRPVPRSVIFFGKAAAGLGLLLLATALPLLVSVLYAAWPGRFAAPFVPGLALPAVSDLLLGVDCYFAALLLGLQPGRWWGRRGVIIAAMAGVVLLHVAGLWPFTLPLLMAALLATAAWGAIFGSLADRPWLGRVALALVLLDGAGTGLLLTAQAVRARWPAVVERTNADYFVVANDGSVFLYRQDEQGRRLTDPQGKTVTDERYTGNDADLLYPLPVAYRDAVANWAWIRESTRDSRNSAQIVNGDYGDTESWYLLPAPRNYFVGYDKRSARRIGICDADGFKDAQAIPRPFTGEPRGGLYESPHPVIVGSRLLLIDFVDHHLRTVFDSRGGTIYGATLFPARAEHPRIALAVGAEVRILEADGAPLLTLPYAHDPARWPDLGIVSTPDFSRLFLRYEGGYSTRLTETPGSVLDEHDAQGRLLHTWSTSPALSHKLPLPWPLRAARLLQMPGPALLVTLRQRAHEGLPDFERPWLRFEDDFSNRELAACFAFAAVLAVVAGFRGRQGGLSTGRALVWITATLVFGLAGLLAFRLSVPWSARVRCPACRRPRPLSAELCPHCGARWDAPTASGAEIFEPAALLG